MRPRRRFVGLPIAVAAIVASGCGSATGTAAVSVGGVEYSQSALRSDLADAIVNGTAPTDVTTRWLNNWIFFTAIGLEMQDRGIVPTAAQIDAAAADIQGREPTFDPEGPGGELRIEQWALRTAALDWAALQFPDAPLPDPDPDNPPNMLCSNHILVETEEQSVDVIARLDAGERFADLATELSIDTASGALGGALGCVGEGTFIPEFEAAAYPAEDGEVVGPVQTTFGFHVIEVLSAGPATAEEHPDAGQEAIMSVVTSGASALQQSAQADVDTLRNSLLEELQAAAIVNYADTVSVASEYGTWDSDQFLIVAPGGSADTG